MPSISSTLIPVDWALLHFITTKVEIPRRKEKTKTRTAIPIKKTKEKHKDKGNVSDKKTKRVSSDEGKDKNRTKTTKG